MKTYYITSSAIATFSTEIEANSIEEARELAKEKLINDKNCIGFDILELINNIEVEE